MATGWLKWFW
jgi:virulence-associated protein VapD